MNREHTDRKYDEELRLLREQLLLMGAKVEEMLSNSMKALIEKNDALAHKMIDFDNDIDNLEVTIDDQCLRILAKRQPVASDLRSITIALKFVTDLERIGDLGVNICERTIELNSEAQLKPYIDLPKMAEVVQNMITESLDAFVSQDVERAQAVLERDHIVDAYYGQVFRELLTYMMEDPKTIHRAIKIQSIAKYLERIGDHATNLAEMVIFMARGKDIRHLGSQLKQMTKPHGVLFYCVHNALISQMAEAWARKMFPLGVRIWSAGSQPATKLDPFAVQVMREVGLDISRAFPKGITEIPIGDVDTVITFSAEEQNVVSPGVLYRESWIIEKPVIGSGTDEERLSGLRIVREKLQMKLEAYMKTWT